MKSKKESFESIFEDLAEDKKKQGPARNKFVILAVYLVLILASVIVAIYFTGKAMGQKIGQTKPSSSIQSASAIKEIEDYAKSLQAPEGKEEKFSWTIQGYDALKINAYDSTSVEEVVGIYGKASSAEGWMAKRYQSIAPQIRLSWYQLGSGESASISLLFEKKAEGYLLIDKEYRNLPDAGLERNSDQNRKFLWTQTDFDALVLGDAETSPTAGSNYSDIVERFGLPVSAEASGQGAISTLSVSYVSPKIDSQTNKISQVDLKFMKVASGDWYLVSKRAESLK